MRLKQLSVFLENKKGRLAETLKILGNNNINMNAFSLAETSEFGIARIIVDDPAKAKQLLNEGGLIVKTADVIAVNAVDEPGALVEILTSLSQADVSVEYMYAFYQKGSDSAMMVFKVDDIEKAEQIIG